MVTNHSDISYDLLMIGAVQLNTEDPFTWSSGMKSPIYCDNRLILSYPDVREHVIQAFVELINDQYPDVEVIAGCATAGIPHAALISSKLDLPMVYVRDKAKGHGKKRQIEGKIEPGQKVVVIEDLISTGGSALKAVSGLKEAGAEVLGVAAIFTYGLNQSAVNFQEAETDCQTLTNFEELMTEALQKDMINETQVTKLKAWIRDPESEVWMLEKNTGDGI